MQSGHAFISYVRDDEPKVKKLIEALTAWGVTTWRDKDKISAGQRWLPTIAKAIREGSFFIACFSRVSTERQRTVMNEELLLAVDQLRLMPQQRSWFIPVLFDDCEIPDLSIGAGQTLRSIQWVEMFPDWSTGVDRLLAAIDPESRELAALQRDLSNPDVVVRLVAARRLASLGSLVTRIAPDLLKGLNDSDERVRTMLASALGNAEAAAAQSVPALLQMADGYGECRRAALAAITKLGRSAIPSLMQLLHANNKRAVDGFAALDCAADAEIPELIALAREGREDAATIVGKLARNLSPRVFEELRTLLLEWLRNRDVPRRELAAKALRAADPMSSKTLAALGEILNEEPTDDYWILLDFEIIGWLKDLGAAAAPIAPSIILRITSRKRGEGLLAGGPLLELCNVLADACSKEAIPALVDVLSDTSNVSSLRLAAAEALRRIGGVDTVGELTKALERPPEGDERFCSKIMFLLIEIRNESEDNGLRMAPVLIDALKRWKTTREYNCLHYLSLVLQPIATPEAREAVKEFERYRAKR